MDDLHEHDLVRTEFTIEGLTCYVERSDAAQGGADIFRNHSFEATVFAQMLVGLAGSVFGLGSEVCHIYYHFEGTTAAFNRGGALYFNLDVFLAQIRTQGWRFKSVVGEDLRPVFVPPKEAVVDWFGVFCHECSHNHIGQHDAEFANWMMSYFTGYLELLNAHLEQNEQRLDRS